MGFTLVTEKAPYQPELSTPYIKLYTSTTPNGYKISILLELLGIDYYVYHMNLGANETKDKYYEEVSMNGRVPGLVYVDENKKVEYISESAAIMTFLCDKYDVDRKYSYCPESEYYYKALEWTYWQMAGLAPMAGQAIHFKVFAKEKIEYGINRFIDETKRLLGVLEKRLAVQANSGSKFVAGDHLSIADLTSFPWVRVMTIMAPEDIKLEDYPKLSEWYTAIENIQEVQKGLSIPKPFVKPA